MQYGTHGGRGMCIGIILVEDGACDFDVRVSVKRKKKLLSCRRSKLLMA